MQNNHPKNRVGSRNVPSEQGKRTGRPSFIAGVGASAGGLEALEALFGAMPERTGMGFVVIIHLKPDQKAMTAELLGRKTRLPVKEAEDGELVRPDHVYVIPPGKELQIYNGSLQLTEPQYDDKLRTPIDVFFHTLAEDQQERAIGIILSGMGSDGSLGLRKIKSELGMAMVQEPASARSTGMPQRAIQTGLADYVVAPPEMPEKLREYAETWEKTKREDREQPTEERRKCLQKIFMLLRGETGHDFSGYKPSTVLRRIDRRQKVHRIDSIEEYVKFLQRHKHEVRILFKEMLIGVTSFFRDPEAFEALKANLRESLANRPAEHYFRAWVVGCATGEEAYSVAIVLRECFDELHRPVEAQIFATDIDSEAIEQARAGRFPIGIARDVSKERLERFFVPEVNEYQVKKEIREMVVFAEQNAIKDPPFTKLDLICCRNMLIYLEAELQQKLLPLFHYSLRRKGLLFLGTAESLGRFHDQFDTVDKKWKIFRRQDGALTRTEIRFPVGVTAHGREEIEREPSRLRPDRREIGMAERVRQALLDLYAPAAVVINRQGEIYYILGRTGKYLEPPSGRVNWNIMEMAREGLKLELTTAIRQAAANSAEAVRTGVRVKTNGGYQPLNLRVRPLEDSEAVSGVLLVAFEEITEESEREGGQEKEEKKYSPPDAERKIKSLEQKLQRTKDNLQTAVEELESSNEELKSTNEEYQSANEELQSTNEELESSREELQSLNEELVTVNSELQSKVEEADRAFKDMKNFLDALEIPTLFLDREMRVQRFSSQASRIVRLIDSDTGRLVSDLVSHLQGEGLLPGARRVLRSLQEERQEVQTEDGHWFQMRIMPYRSPENVIEGVVVVFLDINEQKKAQCELEEAREGQVYAKYIVDTVREPLLVLDAKYRVQQANPSFYRIFRVSEKETEGKSLFELGNRQWDSPRLRELLERILPEHEIFEDFLVEHDFPDIGHRKMLLNARRIERRAAENLILLAIEDVTERKGQ